ncbi:MAG: ribosome-binding factor A [Saprospiraceae bacterium]
MESKRQKQVAEVIRRNFGIVLQQEGSYIYGPEALVTVTTVKITPDQSMAKIYLSVYNTEDKMGVISMMHDQVNRLRNSLAYRIKKHVRRIPTINLYLDDTLDEMYKLNSLFDKLDENKKSTSSSEEE